MLAGSAGPSLTRPIDMVDRTTATSAGAPSTTTCRTRKRLGRPGRRPLLYDLGLEQQLYEWLVQQRSVHHRPVTYALLVEKMREMVMRYRDAGSRILATTLKLTYGWVYGFVRRFHLSLRAITHRLAVKPQQESPRSLDVPPIPTSMGIAAAHSELEATANKMKSFHEHLTRMHRPANDAACTTSTACPLMGARRTSVIDSNWFNMDQTPVWFNTLHLPDRTLDLRGNQKISARVEAGANLREKVTVILACSRRGDKLPPALVVQSHSRRLRRARIQLVDGVMVFHNPGTYMANSDIMQRWIRAMMDVENTDCVSSSGGRGHGGGTGASKRLLIMDSFRGHLTAEVGAACRDTGVVRAVIPGGLTSHLQPLDLTVNRSFKAKLRALYQGEGNGRGAAVGVADSDADARQQQPPAAATTRRPRQTKSQARLKVLAKAVRNAWNQVSPLTIRNGFGKMLRNLRDVVG